MDTRYIYLNGKIVEAEQAMISPFDIGLLRGYAVFDLLRTVGGEPFLLAEHLRRLRNSADELDLTVPATDEEITEAIAELLARNDHEEATVRLVLTGGLSDDGLTFDRSAPTFYILTHDLHEPPAALYADGGALLMEQHRREVPGAKTTNYLTMLHRRGAAEAIGAMDLLYHDGDRVYEAASASFYVVRDGVILAPQDDVLWGTVGTYVLETLCDAHEVEYRTLTVGEALSADEAFLTSTTRGVVPIVRLDDTTIGDGTPGPVTRDLMARWKAVVAGD
jgi:branched-subunit amino acid aminotransferase/4-amino-4-deoxychorismate lyase